MSPREAGYAGRRDGRALYDPSRNRLEVVREAMRFPALRGAFETVRLTYEFAFAEGWSAAEAAHAARHTKE